MSDTPRTDAEARNFWDQWRIANVVQVEFARTLERELTEARRESSRLAPMSLLPPRDYADKLADACGEGCDSDTAHDYAVSAVPLQRFMTTTTEQEPELAPAEKPVETPKPAELVKLELVVKESGVELATAQGLIESFAPIFREVHALLEKAKTAPPVTDATQLNEMKACRELRLALAKLRVAGDKLREKLKRDSLLRGNAVQGVYNLLKFMVEPIETHLEMKEKFAERAQAARLAEKKAERDAAIAHYLPDGASVANVEHMSAETFAETLAGFKAAHEARVAAAEKAEADRIAKEKAEREERARVIAENIRLKEENAAKEAAAMAERVKAESERKLAEEKAAAALAKEREEAARLAREAQAKADAAAKKLREEAAESARVADARAKAEAARVQKEREAIEAKAKAGREALEARAREERQAREIAEAKLAEQAQQAEIARLAKLEAEEKAALAPDKEKLKAYAASILALVIPKLSTPKAADVFAEIAVQRDKFAAWIEKKAEAL